MNKHIILMGFKHVGKSVIGSELAKTLQKPFIDLDQEIELTWNALSQPPKSCREIIQLNGEKYFRELEHQVLQNIILRPSAIIALGGGTPLDERNQIILKSQQLIHVSAPKHFVFERIMRNGCPAFFDVNLDPVEAFESLWSLREQVYRRLANYELDNQHTINHAVQGMLAYLVSNP